TKERKKEIKMKNIVDKSVDEVENEMSRKKKGARPKRPIYFIGVSASGQIQEHEQHPSKSKPISKTDADVQLKKALGNDCTILGPFYKVKGLKKDSEREMVVVSVRDIRYTKNSFDGEYQGWKFYGNGLASCKIGDESFDDDDLIHGEFTELADPNNKAPKPRLMKNAMIRRSCVDNIQSA